MKYSSGDCNDRRKSKELYELLKRRGIQTSYIDRDTLRYLSAD